jgi:hypothetical protein
MNDPELEQALRAAIDDAAAPVTASEARHRAGTRRTRWARGRLVSSGLGRNPAQQDPMDRPSRDEHSGLWLDEEEPSAGRGNRITRRAVGVMAAVVCVAIVGVPVGLALTSTGSSTPSATKLGTSKAKNRVLSALSATISSGSFAISYSEKAVTSPTSTTSTTSPTTSCTSSRGSSGISGGAQVAPGTIPGGSPASNVLPKNGTGVICWQSSGSGLQGLGFSGQGTIDTAPFAMVASTNVPSIGPVTIRDNGIDVWEIGGGNYGLSPGSSDTGPGSPLSGFSGLVEGTLGARQGGLAMMGLASPTGYLELDQNAITSASQVGTGVVDGVGVTIYQVSLNPAQEANVPGTTSEEAIAIRDALALLQREGYSGTTVKVSIDDAGYIRETVSVASFTDGATQTADVTFSNFGCAGKVLMPGEQGATSPPPGCVSPDTSSSNVTPTTVNQPNVTPTTVTPTTVTPTTVTPTTVSPTTSTT